MKNKGFSMVEALVAIAILTSVIIGASAAVQIGISSHVLSKDEIIAFYLAQEGVEQIRNMRDENGLNNRNWLADFAENSSDPCYFGKKCRVDVVANPIAVNECDEVCEPLRQDPQAGFFGYDIDLPLTIFTREISLAPINANEVSILVTVNWGKGSVDRTFSVRENILNWQ